MIVSPMVWVIAAVSLLVRRNSRDLALVLKTRKPRRMLDASMNWIQIRRSQSGFDSGRPDSHSELSVD